MKNQMKFQPTISPEPERQDYSAICATCNKGRHSYRLAVLRNVLDTTAAYVETVLEVYCSACKALQPVRLIPVI